MEENSSQGFTVFVFPREHQHRLRTSNPLERVNRELKRRSRAGRGGRGARLLKSRILRLLTDCGWNQASNISPIHLRCGATGIKRSPEPKTITCKA
jgi:hypothetical protein